MAIEPYNHENTFEVLVKDPKFVETNMQNDAQRAIVKQFTTEIPALLVDVIYEKATTETMCKCIATSLQHLIDNEYVIKIMKAGDPDNPLLEMMLSMVGDTLTILVEQLLHITNDVSAYLKENGFTEEQLMQQIGLSEENLALSKNGELTIQTLLETQPALILFPNNED